MKKALLLALLAFAPLAAAADAKLDPANTAWMITASVLVLFMTLPAGFMENDETAAEGALRETLEEAGARIALDAPFSMISVPRVNQVHLFYRARILDLEFKPGEESLEVALVEEARIPWKDIAFRTVGLTLRHWFADRARGTFGFHAEDLPLR